MQKIKVTKVTPVGKDGTAVFDENGTRFSGFQPELKTANPGDTIEAEIEVKGKYNNIKNVKILEHGAGPASNTTGGHTDYNRESIEAQVAFKGIMQLAAAGIESGHVSMMPGEFNKAYQLALDWAISKLGGNVTGNVKVPLKPIAIEPSQKTTNVINGIDMDWLKESLEKLQSKEIQGWSNAAVIASLNKLTGARAASVSEAVKLLNKKQVENFVNEIQQLTGWE